MCLIRTLSFLPHVVVWQAEVVCTVVHATGSKTLEDRATLYLFRTHIFHVRFRTELNGALLVARNDRLVCAAAHMSTMHAGNLPLYVQWWTVLLHTCQPCRQPAAVKDTRGRMSNKEGKLPCTEPRIGGTGIGFLGRSVLFILSILR